MKKAKAPQKFQKTAHTGPGRISFISGISIEKNRLLPGLLLVVTLVIFSVSLRNQILIGWDDGEYLTHPDVLKAGAGTGSSIFSSFYLGMYQPLAMLSFVINYRIAGDSAAAFIFVNLLLHLLNTWLVYKLSTRWFSRIETSFIIAALFALHPMHVEGVVWISVRSSLMYSAFFLAGLLQYYKFITRKKNSDYYLTLLWFVFALLSKSMAATFPMIMLAVDWFSRRTFSWRVIYEKIPFFILSVIFGIVAIKASQSFGHITVLEKSYDIGQRIVLILYGISFYLSKLLLPVNLSAIYAFPEISNGSMPGWIYLPIILLLLLGVLIWRAKKHRRTFVFGSLFFLLSISMVLPLFWSRIFITADRYTYLPYIGLFAIIAIMLTEVWDKRESLASSTYNMLRIALGLILIMMVITTINRIKTWHDVPELLGDVIENQRSDADMAHGYFYLGNYYDTQGKDEEAVKNYNLAISRNKGYLLAYNNRGILKGKHGDINGAVSDFTEAITLKPDYAEAYYNRGVALYQRQEKDKACSDWHKAATIGFKQANAVINEYCIEHVMPKF